MYLTSLCVLQAAMLSEAIVHSGQDISNQLVVACKAPRHNVTVNDDVPDSSCWQPQTLQQAPVRHLWPVHHRMAGLDLS